MLRRLGILYQSGALFSSMTLAENIALPLGEFTDLCAGRDPRGRVAQAGAGRPRRASRTSIPSQISGGMQKRAGLARAMALDPEILFFDEPSAGLDPISSRLLDDLILELRDSLGADDRRGHARARQHLHHRQQLHLPRRRDAHR